MAIQSVQPTHETATGETASAQHGPFVDRRSGSREDSSFSGERRQFANSHDELTPEARELAMAIDQYKLRNRRRFITYEEMFEVIMQLGYSKQC